MGPQRRRPDLAFTAADALALPFPDDTFDLVIVCTPPSSRARPADEVAQAVEEAGVTAEAVPDPVSLASLRRKTGYESEHPDD